MESTTNNPKKIREKACPAEKKKHIPVGLGMRRARIKWKVVVLGEIKDHKKRDQLGWGGFLLTEMRSTLSEHHYQSIKEKKEEIDHRGPALGRVDDMSGHLLSGNQEKESRRAITLHGGSGGEKKKGARRVSGLVIFTNSVRREDWLLIRQQKGGEK